MEHVDFGGACINNTLVHIANDKLPFGGVSTSGLGNYHGKYSFATYTRPRAILSTANWPDIPVKYPPYNGRLSLFKWLLK